MRVDSFDNSLICEAHDLQETLSYFKYLRQMPDYLEKAVLTYILKELDVPCWNCATVEDYLDRLPDEFVRQSINDINSMFNSNQAIEYGKFYLAYLLYYFPANLFKVWKPLLDLHLHSCLKQELKVLDVGTGPGSVSAGIIEFYRSLANSYPEINLSLVFTLLDVEEEFLKIAVRMINSVNSVLPTNLKVNIAAAYCDKVGSDYVNDALQKYDLIIMSNFLTPNEGNNLYIASSLINGFSRYMVRDGALIIIEPGEEQSCRAMKRARNVVVKQNGLNVYSPCIGIWEEKNTYECACLGMTRSYWKLPAIYDFLVWRGLGKARRPDVPFNYVVLRKDGLRKYSLQTNRQHFTKLIDLAGSNGETVNVIAIIRSVVINGQKVIILLCDGSCSFIGSNDVSLITNNYELQEHGIDLKPIAGEKIKLKKVTAKSDNKRWQLALNKNSSITLEY